MCREGVEIQGILVATPYSIKRLKRTIKKRGFKFIRRSVPRLFGFGLIKDSSYSPLKEFRETHKIIAHSLKRWAHENNVTYKVVSSINSLESEHLLRDSDPDFLIYGGGGIIRKSIIKASRRILNAHLGPLPEIRGMNAIEWSVLLRERHEITIHFIDEGIDTGPIIRSIPVEIARGDSINSIREKAMVSGIKGLVQVVLQEHVEPSVNNDSYRQCFILSRTMIELLQCKLNSSRNV